MHDKLLGAYHDIHDQDLDLVLFCAQCTMGKAGVGTGQQPIVGYYS